MSTEPGTDLRAHTASPTLPAAVPSSSPQLFAGDTATCSALSTRLDALLAYYLRLLDHHERLRAQARAHFRAGHLALAEAHFRSGNRAGVRFGRDLYDDKMVATLRLNVVEAGKAVEAIENDDGLADGGKLGTKDADVPPLPSFPLLPWSMRAHVLQTKSRGNLGTKGPDDGVLPPAHAANGSPAKSATANEAAESAMQLPTPPVSHNAAPTVQDDRPAEHSDNQSGEGDLMSGDLASLSLASRTVDKDTLTRNESADKPDETHINTDQQLPPDPIRQFGILVPMALRNAQASFRKSMLGGEKEASKEASFQPSSNGSEDVVDSGWIKIALLDTEMRAVEIEIRRVRKRLRKAKEEVIQRNGP